MSYATIGDNELLDLLSAGDEHAFSEIYSRYWKLLFDTANNILQNSEAAKDSVQDVFIALWQRRGAVEIQHLKAYLQQATRFQVLKAIRANKVDESFYKRLSEVTVDLVYENPLLFKEQEALLRQILNELPEDCYHVFKLSREEQLTYKQIAGHLNISEKTVEKKMSICLKLIRLGLQKHPELSLSLLVLALMRR